MCNRRDGLCSTAFTKTEKGAREIIKVLSFPNQHIVTSQYNSCLSNKMFLSTVALTKYCNTATAH